MKNIYTGYMALVFIIINAYPVFAINISKDIAIYIYVYIKNI